MTYYSRVTCAVTFVPWFVIIETTVTYRYSINTFSWEWQTKRLWRNVLARVKDFTSPLRRLRCERKPEVLGTFEAERIMVKWHGYCASQNTWEPKDHLPADLVEAFENPDPDPVRVEEARERIGLVFERGMKVPLEYEESIEIRHDVVRFLFPNLPADFRATPINIQDQDLQRAGLETYTEGTINANGSWCRVIQVTFRLLLLKSPAFYQHGQKVSRPIERLSIVFRKSYHAVSQWRKWKKMEEKQRLL